ncbi:MAG: hypothetical protein PHU12_04520 [Candidatus Aenigmarchaeota archaeon]|nr:hypothetical protein [Candidatus Aenigmarchaeota archaeon]
MKKDDREQKIKELEGFLFVEKEKTIEKSMKIIDDGRQFSVRIPKIFSRTMEIDPQKDKALFKIIIPQTKEKIRPKLIMEVVRE